MIIKTKTVAILAKRGGHSASDLIAIFRAQDKREEQDDDDEEPKLKKPCIIGEYETMICEALGEE